MQPSMPLHLAGKYVCFTFLSPRFLFSSSTYRSFEAWWPVPSLPSCLSESGSLKVTIMNSSSKHANNRRLLVESLQKRELMAVDLSGLLSSVDMPTYSIDGTGNNVKNTQWGSTNEALLRIAKSEYSDGVSSLAGGDRPSAREISNVLADQGDSDVISGRNLSAFVYAWGQFIDHDLGLTPTGSTESMSIPVPKGDPYFDPMATGLKVMKTSRSIYDASTGTSVTNPREQVNTLTAWIDGSMIYGSDKSVTDALRTMQDGKLKMDSNGMLPLNNKANFPNGGVPLVNDAHRVPDDQLYAAGDVRATRISN